MNHRDHKADAHELQRHLIVDRIKYAHTADQHIRDDDPARNFRLSFQCVISPQIFLLIRSHNAG